jgi:hypothetical protein
MDDPTATASSSSPGPAIINVDTVTDRAALGSRRALPIILARFRVLL